MSFFFWNVTSTVVLSSIVQKQSSIWTSAYKSPSIIGVSPFKPKTHLLFLKSHTICLDVVPTGIRTRTSTSVRV